MSDERERRAQRATIREVAIKAARLRKSGNIAGASSLEAWLDVMAQRPDLQDARQEGEEHGGLSENPRRRNGRGVHTWAPRRSKRLRGKKRHVRRYLKHGGTQPLSVESLERRIRGWTPALATALKRRRRIKQRTQYHPWGAIKADWPRGVDLPNPRPRRRRHRRVASRRRR